DPDHEGLPVVYGRAAPYIPVIARAFTARRIPVVIGIYLPMIESAYKPCYVNSAGAKGLFQFLPATAEHYGVARADMCDVDKMAQPTFPPSLPPRSSAKIRKLSNCARRRCRVSRTKP